MIRSTPAIFLTISNNNLHTVRNFTAERFKIIAFGVKNNKHLSFLHGGKHAVQYHIKKICFTCARSSKSQQAVCKHVSVKAKKFLRIWILKSDEWLS